MKKSPETKSVVINPKNEDELINALKVLKRNEDSDSITTKWGLGAMILKVYQKKYGEDKLKWLSKESGFSTSTLQKACQFAREFTQDHMQVLTAGTFTPSWRFVVNNMTIGAANFMKAYQESPDFREFRNAVTKLKPAKTKKPRRKSVEELENEINRYKELVAIKDEEIGALTAQIEDLEEQIERLDENHIEDENPAVMEA